MGTPFFRWAEPRLQRLLRGLNQFGEIENVGGEDLLAVTIFGVLENFLEIRYLSPLDEC